MCHARRGLDAAGVLYLTLKLLFDRADRLPLVPKSAEYSAHILSIRLIV